MTWECSVEQAYLWSQHGSTFLVDTRIVEDRVASGVPEGFVYMSWSDVEIRLELLLQHHEKVVLLCAVGQESLTFCQRLSSAFKDKVHSVSGGFDAWFFSNYPVVSYEPSQNLLRFDRQMRLSCVGLKGQQKLFESHVAVVGLGGLGVPALQYLSAAGVGQFTLVDDDVIALSNLPRQVIYRPNDIGRTKVEAACHWVVAHNDEIQINCINQRLTRLNAESVLSQADLILDCSDNILTRKVINEAALKLGTPWVFAAVSDFDFQVSFFDGKDSAAPCFECLFPNAGDQRGEDCDTQGVLGMTPGLAGMRQVVEAIKYLLGLGGLLKGELLIENILTHETKVIKYRANRRCSYHLTERNT